MGIPGLGFYVGQHEVVAHGNPDLGEHRISGGAQVGLDLKVLLDPLKERLDSPPSLVDVGDDIGRQIEVIGQEPKTPLIGFVVKTDEPQLVGIGFPGGPLWQLDYSIAGYPGVFWLFLLSGNTVDDVFARPGDEECSSVVYATEPFEVQVASVEAIDAVRNDRPALSCDRDVRRSTGRDIDEHGDIAVGIEPEMHLEGSPPFRMSGPRDGSQAEIDESRIQDEDRVLELEPVPRRHGLAARLEPVEQIFVDPIVAGCVGVSQCGLRDKGRQT